MKIERRLFIALLIVTLALMPLGLGTSVSLNNGASVKIASPDSLEGVTTMGVSLLYATGAIQTAVDNADPGATIFLKAKKYYDNVDVDKDLKIIGRGASLTTVDGQQLGSVFTIDSGVTVTLSDMTIKNGHADPAGGGINNYGVLTVKNCDLTRNTASYGGGIFSRLGSSTTLDHCDFWLNHATVGGGAINNEGQSLTVNNCKIFSNTADDYGGGIVNYVGTGTVTNSLIAGNTAAAGGGIFNSPYAQITVKNCAITINKAIGSGVDSRGFLLGYGGGIYNDGTMTLKSSVITNNFASNSGGGIYTTGALTQTGNYIALNRPNNIKP